MKNCKNCSNAIRCNTWGEYKCTTRELRYSKPVEDCADFVKRPVGWKEMKCRCEDCLRDEFAECVEVE